MPATRAGQIASLDASGAATALRGPVLWNRSAKVDRPDRHQMRALLRLAEAALSGDSRRRSRRVRERPGCARIEHLFQDEWCGLDGEFDQ